MFFFHLFMLNVLRINVSLIYTSYKLDYCRKHILNQLIIVLFISLYLSCALSFSLNYQLQQTLALIYMTNTFLDEWKLNKIIKKNKRLITKNICFKEWLKNHTSLFYLSIPFTSECDLFFCAATETNRQTHRQSQQTCRIHNLQSHQTLRARFHSSKSAAASKSNRTFARGREAKRRHVLTFGFSQSDGLTGLGGVTDTVLVDGAHSKAVALPLDQVERWEPWRAHQHVQTGQLPAVLPCQGLIQEQHRSFQKSTIRPLSRASSLFSIY